MGRPVWRFYIDLSSHTATMIRSLLGRSIGYVPGNRSPLGAGSPPLGRPVWLFYIDLSSLTATSICSLLALLGAALPHLERGGSALLSLEHGGYVR